MGRKVWYIPLVHPAHILKGQFHKEPAQEVTVERIAHLLKMNTLPEPWNVEEPPPGALLAPSLGDLEEFWNETRTGPWDALSHDLENAGPHIICDGMCQVNTETGEVGRTAVLRFRRQGGDLWWYKPAEHLKACELLYEILADPTVAKVFHNGVTHDVPILEEIGFEVNGRLMDTLLMMHTCYSEMPKGLQFCATLFNFSPVWKHLTSDEEEDEKG